MRTLEDALSDVRQTYKRRKTSAVESTRDLAKLCVDRTIRGAPCQNYRLPQCDRCQKHQVIYNNLAPIIQNSNSSLLDDIVTHIGDGSHAASALSPDRLPLYESSRPSYW